MEKIASEAKDQVEGEGNGRSPCGTSGWHALRSKDGIRHDVKDGCCGQEDHLYRAETAQQKTHEDHTESRKGRLGTRQHFDTSIKVHIPRGIDAELWKLEAKPARTKVECQSPPLLGDEVDGALGKRTGGRYKLRSFKIAQSRNIA